VFFWPLSKMGIASLPKKWDNRVADSIHGKAINLPSYHDMDLADIERVASVLLDSHGK
jgi:perosamine synthetase